MNSNDTDPQTCNLHTHTCMCKHAEGPRKMYPLMNFWEKAAEYDIEVICNSDAHKPEDVFESIDECREIADKFGLKILTIEQVPLDIFSYSTARNQ